MPSEITAHEPRSVTVPAWAALGVVLVITVVAFPSSAASIVAALGSSDPTSLLVLAPVVAVACLVLAVARGEVARQPRLEPAMLLAVPLLLGGVLLSVLGPERFGYSFWFERMDLVALLAFTVAAVVLAVGVRPSVGCRGIAWLLVACAPPLLLPILELTQRSLQAVTAAAARSTAEAIGVLGVRPVGGGDFAAPHGIVSVAAACGGIEGIAGVLLMAGPILAGTTGSRQRTGLLIVGAAAAAIVLNLLRVIVLLALAGHGHDGAFTRVHSVAGVTIIALVAAGMLIAAQRLGLRWSFPAGVNGLTARVHYRQGHLLAAGIAVGSAAAVILVTQLGGGAGSGIAMAASDSRPHLHTVTERWGAHDIPLAVTDHSVVADQQQEWFREFFGPGSRAESFTILRGADAPVWAEVVTAPSLRALDNYGPVACFVAHGATLYRVRTVVLPGGAGTLVEQRQRDVRFSALTFTQPVVLPNGHDGYRRTLLFAKASPAAAGSAAAAASAPRTGSTLQRMALGVLNAFAPEATHTSPGWSFAAADAHLLSVAADEVRAPSN